MASPLRKARRRRADKTPLEPECFPARPRVPSLRFQRNFDCKHDEEVDLNSARSIGASAVRHNPRDAHLVRDQKLHHE